MRQKARSRWIKEGDNNSHYFHLLLNSNRRFNEVNGVLIDGAWVDELARVKELIPEGKFSRVTIKCTVLNFKNLSY